MSRRRTPAILLTKLGLGVAGCTASSTPQHGPSSSGPARVVITAEPSSALLDSTVTVTVAGLAPKAITTLTASARDEHGAPWSSSAQFAASSSGSISVAAADSTAGSYGGRDPMGLFDLMTPLNPGDHDQYFISPRPGTR